MNLNEHFALHGFEVGSHPGLDSSIVLHPPV